VDRRAFFTGVLGLLAAPLAAEAHLSDVCHGSAISASCRDRRDAFEQELKELGYEDGRNIVLERRWTEGNSERLPALAAELVRLNVDVIVTPNEAGVNAVRRITSTLPIVFWVVGDPVGSGTRRASGDRVG
jgi:ABC-type uncharacterized transport system substrate-binding protein